MKKFNLEVCQLENRTLLSGLTPSQLQKFYGLKHKNSASLGAGVTIAVVVAYDDSTAASDVTEFFDRPYRLAKLSMSTYNLGGKEEVLGWSGEAENDIEMVHVMAPLAHIDLVEAASDDLTAMMQANQYAASLPGVSVVSNSWGNTEFSTESRLDKYLTAPNVTFIAAAGDYSVPNYPAVSPFMIAVGGVRITGNHAAIWNSSGSGYSADYPGRKVPDVNMAVNGPAYSGTSVSAPLFAGIVGIADALRAQSGKLPLSTAQVRAALQIRGMGLHMAPAFISLLQQE